MENYSLPTGFQLRDKYSIQKVLGQGGFGITYLAEDMVLDIDVCIKELYVAGNSTRGANMTVLTQNTNEFSFVDFKDKFISEAKQLAKFNHPNIVRVREFFEANNTVYVVMEYIEGKTLKDLILLEGSLSADFAKNIIENLLDAVQVVHDVGMLHRDIKPDNLIISKEGRVVLIDFGSARAFSDEKTIAQTAFISPGYAPLEQYNPNARKGTYTDIYSIGATFYFMLTSIKPLNVTERYTERLKAPHEINQQIGVQVSSAVMLAMEMKPEDRFQDVRDFRNALYQLKAFEEKNQKEKDIIEEKILTPKSIIPLNYMDEFGLEFVLVNVGSFYMGAKETDLDSNYDNRQIFVKLSKPYYLGKYPVTQAQWEKVMGYNPSTFKNRPNCPVETVSWEDCQEFINRLNVKTGREYRLPTEAEWEYAAIGSNECKKYLFSGSNNLEELAWFELNSKNLNAENKILTHNNDSYQPIFGTQNVGLKKPNELGLYDMSGNVWEWCLDCYDSYETRSTTNPLGNKLDGNKVFRGGSWNYGIDECYVTYRNRRNLKDKFSDLGFRVLLQV